MNSINLTDALERFGGDREIYQEMVETFIATVDSDFAQLHSQLASGQKLPVASVIHRIKGSLATLGADDFSLSAGKLEKMLKTPDSAQNELSGLLEETGELYDQAIAELREIAKTFRTQS